MDEHVRTILVCGSRGWTFRRPIEAVLEREGNDIRLIHGGCRGADLLAAAIALQRGIDPDNIISEDADWNQYGSAAGFIRNQLMLDRYHPDAVYAFRATGKSNGTDDMVERSLLAKIHTEVIRMTA